MYGAIALLLLAAAPGPVYPSGDDMRAPVPDPPKQAAPPAKATSKAKPKLKIPPVAPPAPPIYVYVLVPYVAYDGPPQASLKGAYMDGVRAHVRKAPKNTNPYTRGTDERQWWYRGWRAVSG